MRKAPELVKRWLLGPLMTDGMEMSYALLDRLLAERD
jgi:hypothetical protein